MKDKRLDNYYLPINQFIKDHNNLSYIEFDYDIVHKLNLFIYNDSIDFDKLEEEITKIEKSLPAIKRIFQKPIIRLSDTSEVLPVEAVRTVDNQTLSHIQNHSELWSDIKSNNIRPNKLLTRTYYDNYAIYENIAFKKCIDLILQFCRNNMHLLKELIYSSDVLDVNLLERVNHLNYFLALGKLHTSYIRDFSKYYSVSSQIINRLEEINKVVKARLKRPVYRMNKKYKGRFSLHQTNILYMDKNYKKVYSLLKGFKAKDYKVDDLILDDKKINDDYFNYALVLLIFSIGHFNFETEDIIEFDNLNLNFKFKKYNLILTCDKDNYLLFLKFESDKEYKIIISTKEKNKIEIEADEIIYLDDELNISIDSIDSFRKLWQIILRGMIYSNNSFDICPFCGDELEKTEDGYLCNTCMTLIEEVECPSCNNKFINTKIYNYNKRLVSRFEHVDDEWDLNKRLEGQMCYRNINKLSFDGKCVCPKCKK